MLTEIQEHPPSTLENVDGTPLAGVDGDPGVATINVKNVDGRPPWGGVPVPIRDLKGVL
jgi:hypothetical protein